MTDNNNFESKQGQITEQNQGQAPVQSPGQAPGQYPGQAPGQSPGQGPGQFPGQAPGQYPGQGPGQHPGQAPGWYPGQGTAQYPRQVPGQGPGQYPGQVLVFDPEDIKQNKIIACLSYLPLLVFIPIFIYHKSQFARRHANQGLILLIIEALLYVFTLVIENMSLFSLSLYIAIAISLLIMSIVYIFTIRQIFICLNGRFEKFPLVGDFNLLK
jgi:hypothetical protein